MGDIISCDGQYYIPETGGYIFPKLIKIYEELEEKAKDRFEGTIVFSFFTFFHNKMKINFGKNIDLKVQEVDFDELLNFILNYIKETDEFFRNNNLKKRILKLDDIEDFKFS